LHSILLVLTPVGSP